MPEILFFPEPHIIAQIGPVALYFYGAMYALSALCAYGLLRYWNRKKNLGISSETLLDLVFITLLTGVIGGRLFYVLVYNASYFWEYPLQIFAVWNGGMSIHGGLLGGAIGFYIFCRIKKIDLLKLADIAVPSIALGMVFGRLGNFINGELPGRITSHPWGMDFGDGEMRHPSQLYAMAKDTVLFVLFSILVWKVQWKHFAGGIMAGFLMMYAVFRFAVEFFREPDPQLGFLFSWLTMGQILSVILFILGLSSYIFLQQKKG